MKSVKGGDTANEKVGKVTKIAKKIDDRYQGPAIVRCS